MKNSLSHAEFLQKEKSFIDAVAKAMEDALAKMGNDVKGITWFCSSAENYTAQRYKRAS